METKKEKKNKGKLGDRDLEFPRRLRPVGLARHVAETTDHNYLPKRSVGLALFSGFYASPLRRAETTQKRHSLAILDINTTSFSLQRSSRDASRPLPDNYMFMNFIFRLINSDSFTPNTPKELLAEPSNTGSQPSNA